MTSPNESEGKGKLPQDPAELTFEKAIEELDAAVGKLEDGTLTLEQQVAFYERGMKLVKACREKLDTAAARIEKVVATEEGETTTEPFEESEHHT